MKCKASETKHLLPALLTVCLECNTGSPHDEHRLAAVNAMDKLVSLYDRAGIFLTSSQHNEALQLTSDFYDAYNWLQEWAVEEDRYLHHVVPKFHMFHHMVLNGKYLNPKVYWTFKAEDYVGKISKLAASVAFGVKSTRLSLKVALKYRHLVHFRFTLGAFS